MRPLRFGKQDFPRAKGQAIFRIERGAGRLIAAAAGVFRHLPMEGG